MRARERERQPGASAMGFVRSRRSLAQRKLVASQLNLAPTWNDKTINRANTEIMKEVPLEGDEKEKGERGERVGVIVIRLFRRAEGSVKGNGRERKDRREEMSRKVKASNFVDPAYPTAGKRRADRVPPQAT